MTAGPAPVKPPAVSGRARVPYPTRTLHPRLLHRSPAGRVQHVPGLPTRPGLRPGTPSPVATGTHVPPSVDAFGVAHGVGAGRSWSGCPLLRTPGRRFASAA